MAPRSAKSVADTIAKLAVEHWQDEFVKDTFCLVVLKMWVALITIRRFVQVTNADRLAVSSSSRSRFLCLLGRFSLRMKAIGKLESGSYRS